MSRRRRWIRAWIWNPFREIWLEDHMPGLSLLFALWQQGRRGRTMLSVLGFGLTLSLYLAFTRQDHFLNQTLVEGWTMGLVLIIGLMVIFSDWMPWWGRLMTQVYALFYLSTPLILASSVSKSAVFLLPLVGFFFWEASNPHRASGWRWLLWTLALAQFLPYFLPWPTVWSVPVRLIGGTFLGTVLLLGLSKIFQRTVWRPWARIILFLLTLLAPFVWLAWYTPQALTSGFPLWIQSLWYLMYPIWLWLGFDLITDSELLVEFLMKRIPQALVSLSLIAVMGLGLLGTVLAGLIWMMHLYSAVMPIIIERVAVTVEDLMLTLPFAWWATLLWGGPLLTLMGGMGWILGYRQKFSPDFQSAWLMSMAGILLGLYGFFQTEKEIIESPAYTVELGWAFMAMSVPLLWEKTKAVWSLWKRNLESLWFTSTLVLFVVLTTPMALYFAKGYMPLALMISGAWLWGLPWFFARMFHPRMTEEDATAAWLLGYMLSWVLAIAWPRGGWAFPVLTTLALIVGMRQRGWFQDADAGRPWLGAMAGLGAVGFLSTCWFLPLPVPFLSLWALQRVRLACDPGLPFLSFAQWMFVLSTMLFAPGITLALTRPSSKLKKGAITTLLVVVWGLWNAFAWL